MPYIKQADRVKFDDVIDQLCPNTAGELNYVVTSIIHQHMKRNGGMSYTKINEMIGMLECAKLELYRRKASPYEDLKIEENGDVI
jgi:hypothetical protein